MAKRKPKTEVRRLRDKAEELCREYVRLRDGPLCCWCGKRKHLQWSHVKGRRIDSRLVYHPINSKMLCYTCHFTKWHLDPAAAIAWFEGRCEE